MRENPLLTTQEMAAFFEEGYALREGVFSQEEVGEISAAFDRLHARAKTFSAPTYANGALFVVNDFRIDRIVWCGGAEAVLLDYGSDPRLTQPAAQLLGSSRMEQIICQAHFKLPEDGVGFGWHQDSVHRRYGTPEWTDVNGKGSFVQTILAVDPAGAQNGPLMILPGSCHVGHLAHKEDVRTLEGIDMSLAVPLLMEPGSVLFLGPYTIHGSLPNHSKRSRRVFINGYAFPGANRRVYPGEGAGRVLLVEKDQIL